MFETIYLLVAILGSSLAGLFDLVWTRTNVPDNLVYGFIGSGIVLHIIESFYISSFNPIILSLQVGGLFLIFGLFMYYTGNCGAADTGILAGIGFTLPTAITPAFFPFALSYFINLTIIGAVYSIIYVLYLMNKKGIRRNGLEFYRRVLTSKLKVDDVIGEDMPKINIYKKKIKGLTKAEINKIKRHKKYTIIREGIPYTISFPIALAFTLYFGDLILFLV